MLLVIDIGNTNLSIGCLQEEKICFEARIATDRSRTSDQYGVEIKNMLEAYGVKLSDIDDCIISSVVPPVLNAVRTGVMRIIGRQPMVVKPGLKTGLNICVDNPNLVGSDLVVGAVGALSIADAPLIVIDMGTATTLTVLGEGNKFLGGVIIPGLHLSMEALSGGTSLLPRVSLDAPEKCIGTNTVECMQSGAIFGSAAMLDGMIERLEAELGQKTTVIATGGLAGCVTPFCKREIRYEPDLLFTGLAVLWEKNRRDRRS